jgi:hypothetical protein
MDSGAWVSANRRPAPVFAGDGEPFVELIKELKAPADAISIDTDANVLFRVEGFWHVPSAFEAGEV